jgi:excisionase family DNA binding protein
MAHPPVELVVDPGSTLDKLPTLMMVDELARLLRVNRNTLYESVQRGEVPGVVYVGRSIRFVRDIVLQWLGSQGRVSRSVRTTHER